MILEDCIKYLCSSYDVCIKTPSGSSWYPQPLTSLFLYLIHLCFPLPIYPKMKASSVLWRGNMNQRKATVQLVPFPSLSSWFGNLTLLIQTCSFEMYWRRGFQQSDFGMWGGWCKRRWLEIYWRRRLSALLVQNEYGAAKMFIRKYKNLRKSDKIIDFNKENINQHKNERGKSKLETNRPYVEFEGWAKSK